MNLLTTPIFSINLHHSIDFFNFGANPSSLENEVFILVNADPDRVSLFIGSFE